MNKFYSFEGNFKKYQGLYEVEDLTAWVKAIIGHRMENATTEEAFDIAIEGNKVIEESKTAEHGSLVLMGYIRGFIIDTFKATGKVIDHDFKLVDPWTAELTKEEVLGLSNFEASELMREVIQYEDHYFDHTTKNALLRLDRVDTAQLYRWADQCRPMFSFI